jgi:tRNA(Arg) A34 adenosine deaminase TadA
MKKHKLDEKYMRLAVAKARTNLKTLKGGPFGACIVKDGKVLAVARNTVLSQDATCHAEINAIRAASRATGSYDLSGAVIYSTTEPCPMCFCAIHWARIACVAYGTSIRDAEKIGFNEMKIGNRRLKTLGKSSIEIVPNFLRGECEKLFADWYALPGRRTY